MRLPEISITSNGDLVRVSVNPPPGTEKAPCDICCVVDVSGSMNTEAKLKDGTGKTEGFGLNLLDVVKHAVKTIIHCLSDTDRLALVAFTTNARVVFELLQMDPAGKRRALSELDRLHPEASTNIWDGLHKGLDVLQRGLPTAPANSARQVILLTDGMPNVIPPRGHIPMLQEYRDQHGGSLGCSIQTFGFGYSLDSKLLDDLAAEGGANYAFIPDSSFVGTVFVNALANLQCTIAEDIRISCETMNGARIVEVLGSYQCSESSWGVLVRPGALRFGQSRDIVLRMEDLPEETPFLTVHLEMTMQGSEDPVRVECVSGPEARVDAPEMVLPEVFRLEVVKTIAAVMEHAAGGRFAEAQEAIRVVTQMITESGVAANPYVSAVVEDLSGQITEATSRQDWFQKWGRHYLPSLSRAHLLQVCNNFKDPGVQKYGGEGGLFANLRDAADKVFLDLPPPKPSVKRRARPGATPAPVLASMSRFHSCSAPCFAGNSLVQMASPGMPPKRVDLVRKGDIVASADGPAKVVCVIRTECVSGTQDLVNLNGSGLWITPWHPVRLAGGVWQFPANVGTVLKSVPCPAVFSFILDSSHTMFINGIECVSLGHGFSSDPVVSHPYFGSNEKIVNDLKRLRGWKRGLVRLVSGRCLARDDSTGLVSGLLQQ